MGFWEDFLSNPPFEVRSQLEGLREDTHAVLRRGYQDFDFEELWNFGAGNVWRTYPAPLPSFLDYGGRTLCGLRIESGEGMYGPRWEVFRGGYGEGRGDPALLDMHGISCMVCRRKLMYGVCRIIDRLTSLRDAVGEAYVQKPPLVHGKEVLSTETTGSTRSETYRYRCQAAAAEINPRLVNEVEEFDLITCPDCIANIRNAA